MKRFIKFIKEFPKHAFIWVVLFFALFPLYVTLAISFKDSQQFFNRPWVFTWPLHGYNWTNAWSEVGGTIFNSIFLCMVSTVLVIVLSILAAYFFGRFRMPGHNALWAAFMTLMMMPSVVNLVPLFSLLQSLDWLNTYSALIVVYTTAGQVISVFLLRGFVEDIPNDLFEASEVDGASHLQRILYIVTPMSMPIISTIAILRFVASWNEFILPLIILRDQAKFPVSVKLYQLEGAYIKDWGSLMAGYALAAIPLILLFIFSMRFFVKGLTSGALKG